MKKIFSFICVMLLAIVSLFAMANSQNVYASTTYSRDELKTYVRQYQNNTEYIYSSMNNSAYTSYIKQYPSLENPNFFTMIENVFLNIKDFESGPGYTFTLSTDDEDGYSANFEAGYHYFVDADFVSYWLSKDSTAFKKADVYIYGNEDASDFASNYFSSAQLTYIQNNYFDEMSFNSCNGACIIPFDDFYLESYSSISHDTYTVSRFDSIDIIYPEFTASTYYITFNVDNPLTHNEILGKIGAKDETDGYISDRVKLESTSYDPENFTLISYPFRVSVSDTAGNTTYATFYIQPYDIGVPTISGTDTYNLSYNDELTLEMIKSNLIITDNFDKSLSLDIVSDTYSGNENKVGSYSIVFNTTDDADNTSANYTVNIEIKDEIGAIISVPETITVSNSSIMTLETLKSKINVVDDYYGQINNYTITGYDEYVNKYDVVGTYLITITAVDGSNNTSTTTFNVVVKDDIAPEIFIERSFVMSVPVGTEITKDMILSYLDQIGEININQASTVACAMDDNNVYTCYVLYDDGTEYKAKLSVNEFTDDDSSADDTSTNFKDNVNNFVESMKENKALSVALSGLFIVVIAAVVIAVIKAVKRRL